MLTVDDVRRKVREAGNDPVVIHDLAIEVLVEIARQEHADDCTSSAPLNECVCLDDRDPASLAAVLVEEGGLA